MTMLSWWSVSALASGLALRSWIPPSARVAESMSALVGHLSSEQVLVAQTAKNQSPNYYFPVPASAAANRLEQAQSRELAGSAALLP